MHLNIHESVMWTLGLGHSCEVDGIAEGHEPISRTGIVWGGTWGALLEATHECFWLNCNGMEPWCPLVGPVLRAQHPCGSIVIQQWTPELAGPPLAPHPSHVGHESRFTLSTCDRVWRCRCMLFPQAEYFKFILKKTTNTNWLWGLIRIWQTHNQSE